MTGPPRWAVALLRTVAPPGEVEDVLGDLEEAHRRRARRHNRLTAAMLTVLETLDMAAALLRARVFPPGIYGRSHMLQDYRLGLRMLVKYPGLTIAGGLALAIAIGIGAAWYDLTRDLLRPTLPLSGGDRIVEIEMRDAAAGEDERRILHDFVAWQRDARTVENLGAWQTLQRNLVIGDAEPEPVLIAEMSASAFRLTRVPPRLGRTLLDADEQPGAPPVVVLGYHMWQRRFGGREDVIGRSLQLGTVTTTIVGVMPDGFAFPVNHGLWAPLPLRPSGYAPLEGVAIRVFGRLAAGATQAQANAELVMLAARTAAASPRTHEHLRPRVLAYGGQSPGDRSIVEVVATHLPILLVLVVACANVGTLIYARTATREAEIAMRYALGASRGRIVLQLFVEALVLASAAALLGLAAAHWGVKWGVTAFYSGRSETLPFWLNPGLKLTTMIYAAGLTVTAAAILGVLPAIKATGSQVQAQLRTLSGGGATLRFGRLWTVTMIGQVALTVMCLPPAMGITWEAIRDRLIRAQFPAERYLAVRVEFERDIATTTADEKPVSDQIEPLVGELERRIAEEPGVTATTFADRLPGMQPSVRRGEVEVASGEAPVSIANLWTASVGPGFFEAFDRPIVAGRDFNGGDRRSGALAVLVNEAFARRYMGGATPVGRRVRFASAANQPPNEWFEIVGMVRDVGMTPTDLGEAPYVFHAASASSVYPAVMGVRVSGDPDALARRVRTIAAGLDPRLRLSDVRSLDDLVWRVDVPNMVVAGMLTAVVGLGLFLSAAGIFALMSVSVARRTREIGLRAALGASRSRLLAGIFSRALVLVGSGIAAGNLVVVLLATLATDLTLTAVAVPLLQTSTLMLTVGLLACIEPARRALRIAPTEALKEA